MQNRVLSQEMENQASLISRMLTKLGDIYQWKGASKACFAALGASFPPIVFGLWFWLHYLQLTSSGTAYIPMTVRELTMAINLSVLLGLLLFVDSVLATWCVLKDRFHKEILNFTLVLLSFCYSIVLSIVGVFDGISWLLILIYSATGLIFLGRLQVFLTVTLLVLLMVLWSFLDPWLPFNVRAYHFTNAITISSMTLADLIATWLVVLLTSAFCSAVLNVLMGAWRHREKDLHTKSYRDELTSLYNRRAIQDGLKEEFFRAKRGEYPLSIAIVDLDHFKVVNDTHGHPFGDKVLKIVAAKMYEITRKKDLLGRYGGEEFLIVFPECEGEQARKILERLRENMEAQIIHTPKAGEIQVTLSAGIAELDESDGIDDLIKRADKALYHAKDIGRNKVIHG